MAGIIAKKLEMTRIIHNGVFTPATLVAVPKLSVAQVKTLENDGYSAVVVAMHDGKKITLREFAHDGIFTDVKKGDEISLDMLE